MYSNFQVLSLKDHNCHQYLLLQIPLRVRTIWHYMMNIYFPNLCWPTLRKIARMVKTKVIRKVFIMCWVFFERNLFKCERVGFIQVSTNYDLPPLYNTGKLMKIIAIIVFLNSNQLFNFKNNVNATKKTLKNIPFSNCKRKLSE